jgi:microcin C transport system ATP-binding protein
MGQASQRSWALSMPDQKLLDIRDLTIAFRPGADEAPAVDGISFGLERGRTLALVGESGSGKSVTALSIVRLLPPGVVPTGKALFKGEDLLTCDAARLRAIRGAQITMVFQEPMTSLNPLHTIERQVGEILELHGARGAQQIRARVVALLEEVGIPDPSERLGAFPHQLSGGQRQRVMIAMALANRPDLFIADEPTTALDVTVQAQILDLLKELQARHGMAMLFITHDLNIVRKIADDVAVMQKGKIVEANSVAQIFASPRHPYTQALIAAEPKGEPPKVDRAAKTILAAQDVRVWFPIKRGFFRKTVGFIKAVDGLSVTVREGETVGVVGESGSGKTTLGLAILRLIRSEGAILFLGRRIDGLRFKAMRPLRRRTLTALFRRASRWPRSSPRDSACRTKPSPMGSAARSSRARFMTPASIRRRWIVIRTNSPAARGSASRSPGRWFSSRNSSSSMSRHPRSTCRCRRRSSIFCATCKSGAASPIFSSAMTSEWSAPWPAR